MRVKIPNDMCVPEIDDWLRDTVGPGNFKECFGYVMTPWRSFEFVHEEDATMFALKWL
jgi:hypothetical protein